MENFAKIIKLIFEPFPNLLTFSQAQAELDELIASECVFCGDIMVRNIDKPFIEDQEFDKVMAEWMWVLHVSKVMFILQNMLVKKVFVWRIMHFVIYNMNLSVNFS